ncbi:MAG TPA: alpha/beta hydrolase [Solirubrobacter sp.]|nr:alpha/beta hydrolase [Solirubrobacter sp.]
MCLHGFTGSWRVWELVLPRLERRFDVLAPTLPGHAGGPPLPHELTATTMVEGVERALDQAGFETAHVVGNSLGGHVALQLAARGRARSVVALAPAGGWPLGDPSKHETLDFFVRMQELLRGAAAHAAFIASTPQGRRQALAAISERTEHIPPETVVHVIQAGALCADAPAMLEFAAREEWTLDASRIACPVRIVWGTADKLLPWPRAATRYRREWLPHADWVELEGVGHCPQLDVPLETAELIAGFA